MIVIGDHHCSVRAHLAHQAGPALYLDVGSGGFFELGQILEARHGEIRGQVLAISLLSNSQFRKFVHFVQTIRSIMPSKTKTGPAGPVFSSAMRTCSAAQLVQQLARHRVGHIGRFALQRRQQLAGQLLAQLHAELVERIDAPHHRLHVDAVLVHRDQRAQRLRGERIEQDHRARAAARVAAVRVAAVLAVGQRLGLRQHIGHQRSMVFRVRVVVVHGADEIGRHHAGALMQRLEEAVLHIGAGTTPPHRRGVAVHRRAIELDALAQALHHQLLQVSRQQCQALVVGHHRVRGATEQVAVPHCRQAMQHRNVFFQRRVEHMCIELRGAFQQLFETLETNGQCNRETHCRPQRVAPAHPVPHRQHAAGCDVEGLGGTLGVGTDRVQPLAATEPGMQDAAVEQGFLGAEGLGDQDAGGACRIQRGQRALHRRAIDVGDEMHAQARSGHRTQGIGHQPRTQVRATDADTDYIGDLGRFQLLDQRAHALAHVGSGGIRLRCHRCVGQIAAQRGMQGRALFGDIDLLATEQALERAGKIARARDGEQRIERGAVVLLPREVEIQRTDLPGVLRRPFRLGGKQCGDGSAAQALGVGVKRVESVGVCHAACVGMLWLVWEIAFCAFT
ncbi:hypothetical protein XFF7766_730028 [Xanthomonas citri pv. fuscans]|nr:hypothetical protein XFF6960_930012 [Xanthomonas citri pv. fuscans]SOO16077.1 hypothetical protein XFF7766_730028 [Xanthomonas citri pv. fuscans]